MDMKTSTRLMQRRLARIPTDGKIRTVGRVAKFLHAAKMRARHEAAIAAMRAANWESAEVDQAPAASAGLVTVLASLLGGRIPGRTA